MILRLYGTGRVITPGMPEWEELVKHFDLLPGARQIMYVHVHGVKTSCGYSVPFFSYTGERNALNQWAAKQGEEALEVYRAEKNRTGWINDYIGQKSVKRRFSPCVTGSSPGGDGSCAVVIRLP